MKNLYSPIKMAGTVAPANLNIVISKNYCDKKTMHIVIAIFIVLVSTSSYFAIWLKTYELNKIENNILNEKIKISYDKKNIQKQSKLILIYLDEAYNNRFLNIKKSESVNPGVVTLDTIMSLSKIKNTIKTEKNKMSKLIKEINNEKIWH